MINDLTMKLSAIASKCYLDFDFSQESKLVYIKNRNDRDVVTKLDMYINQTIVDFIKTQDNCILLSEEGMFNPSDMVPLKDVTYLIDPVDGSQNVQLGIPHFSTLIAKIENYSIPSSSVCLPQEGVTLNYFNSKFFSSRKLKFYNPKNSPSYFAYPPCLDDEDIKLRVKIFDEIDNYSTGIYRWGSAGIGLYYHLIGSLKTFVGYKVRPWDVIPYLPILLENNIPVSFYSSDESFYIISSTDINQYESTISIFQSVGVQLKEYKHDSEIHFSTS